jgi:hypothetical protein
VRPTLTVLFLPGLAVTAASAQQVHVVAPAAGPGVDFSSLQAAVDAAASGEVAVLVEDCAFDSLPGSATSSGIGPRVVRSGRVILVGCEFHGEAGRGDGRTPARRSMTLSYAMAVRLHGAERRGGTLTAEHELSFRAEAWSSIRRPY